MRMGQVKVKRNEGETMQSCCPSRTRHSASTSSEALCQKHSLCEWPVKPVQADLCVMRSTTDPDTVIDGFSKKAHAQPFKSQTGESVTKAFESVFTHPCRAALETLLHFCRASLEQTFRASLFFKDTAADSILTVTGPNGRLCRRAAFTAESSEVDVLGPLHGDSCSARLI